MSSPYPSVSGKQIRLTFFPHSNAGRLGEAQFSHAPECPLHEKVVPGNIVSSSLSRPRRTTIPYLPLSSTWSIVRWARGRSCSQRVKSRGRAPTLLRDASAKLPQQLPLTDILSNPQPHMDHPLMPFPNAALDQPINAEMDHRETGADTSRPASAGAFWIDTCCLLY